MFRKTAKGLEQKFSIISKEMNKQIYSFEGRKKLPTGKEKEKGYQIIALSTSLAIHISEILPCNWHVSLTGS